MIVSRASLPSCRLCGRDRVFRDRCEAGPFATSGRFGTHLGVVHTCAVRLPLYSVKDDRKPENRSLEVRLMGTAAQLRLDLLERRA